MAMLHYFINHNRGIPPPLLLLSLSFSLPPFRAKSEELFNLVFLSPSPPLPIIIEVMP